MLLSLLVYRAAEYELRELKLSVDDQLRIRDDHVAQLQSRVNIWSLLWHSAFSALTLLVGRQEEHLACKKLSDEVLAWLSVCSEVQMICILSSWCHCHPVISPSWKSWLV